MGLAHSREHFKPPSPTGLYSSLCRTIDLAPQDSVIPSSFGSLSLASNTHIVYSQLVSS